MVVPAQAQHWVADVTPVRRGDAAHTRTPPRAGGAAAGLPRQKGKARRALALVLSVALVAGGLLLLLASGLLLATALAEKESGAGNAFADRVEQVIRRDESLHYQIHMALGKLLSLCPCTRGHSAEQYRKASFHAPEDVRQSRALKAKLPDLAGQIDALVACQAMVRERAGAAGSAAVFPPLSAMSRNDIEQAVFDNDSGTIDVVQGVALREGGEHAGASAPTNVPADRVYTCDVRKNVWGRWTLVSLQFLD